MRRATRCLPAVIALLLLASCGADRARINKLRSDIQQLRGEMRRQHERIVELERREAARRGMVSLVGSYVIDADALVKLMLPETLSVHRAELAKLDKDARTKREQEITRTLRTQAESLPFSLVLAPDGTCELDDGTAEGRANGTWSVEGERLTLDLTVDPKDPDVMTARIEGTRLYLDEPKFVLQKR